MLYLEREVAPPLSRFIRILWYARAPQPEQGHQRILPSGCGQLILSLSRDFLLDCPEGQPEQRTAPALMVGQRSIYEIINTSDLADLIGIMFEPGGLSALAGDRTDLFSNRSMDLEQVWGGYERSLRDRLREISLPQERLRCLEEFLLASFTRRIQQTRFSVHPAVEFGLMQFLRTSPTVTVASVARETGWSERRFTQLFREQVGFAPKAWYRLQRFQSALRQLHAGVDIGRADLAAACGFYDQAHFANEFRRFSGIDSSTYVASCDRLWKNHTQAD